MVMRAHHDKESEEEDEDSGHDELDVSAGDLMIKNIAKGTTDPRFEFILPK